MLTLSDYYDIAITSFFDIRHVERDYYVWAKLHSRGYKVLIITNIQESCEYFRQKGVDAVNIAQFSVPKMNRNCILEECRRIQNTYLLEQSFYKFVETNYLQAPALFPCRNTAVRHAIIRFRQFEALFEKTHIDCLFQIYTADIDRMALWLVAKKKCRCVWSYTASGLPDKEVVLVANSTFEVVGLKKRFEEIKSYDKKFMSNLRKKILELKKTNQYLPPPQFGLITKLRKLKYVKGRIRKSRKTIILKKLLNHLFVFPCRRLMIRHITHMPVAGEKYVFYPMHAPLESQVIVRGFPYRNEFELIKSIALSLPFGFKLYVKEHPGYEGWYSLREFKSLSSYPQICIVPASLNSHDLIRNAKLSIVINSTVWIEALLFNTPVLTLGSGFFSGFGVCHEVLDLNFLDRAIEKALRSPPDKERAGRFMQALYDVSYPLAFRYYLTQSPAAAGQKMGDFIADLLKTPTVAYN
ncbi:MAG: hypothetical protein JRH18_11635 [Deltaproteobacteria bacterium]|nr:hypothetical protein [Deltaproteobacteria bacterium]MBW2152309.1 hypothetical protein [Deltaproteobacteria bacterium]